MKKSIKTFLTAVILLTLIGSMAVLSSCTKATANEPAETKTGETEVPATGVPATEAPDTEVPETEAPTPTPEPKPMPAMLDPGTEYFYDLSEYGDGWITINPNPAMRIEEVEQGILLSSIENDPFFSIGFDASDQVTAEEYKYVAFRLKASKNDLIGELRYASTTDGRCLALVTFNYATPGEWETVVLDLSKAEYANPDTIEGDITSIRFDPYNDGLAILSDDYTVLIESFAFFNDLETAQKYNGLYKWED